MQIDIDLTTYLNHPDPVVRKAEEYRQARVNPDPATLTTGNYSATLVTIADDLAMLVFNRAERNPMPSDTSHGELLHAAFRDPEDGRYHRFIGWQGPTLGWTWRGPGYDDGWVRPTREEIASVRDAITAWLEETDGE